jgi:hypothetical protein
MFVDGVLFTVNSGDIWLKSGVPYVYVSPEDIANGESYSIPAINGVGGWRSNVGWLTRSFNFQSGTQHYSRRFYEVNKTEIAGE